MPSPPVRVQAWRGLRQWKQCRHDGSGLVTDERVEVKAVGGCAESGGWKGSGLHCTDESLGLLSSREDSSDCLLLGRLTPSLLTALLLLVEAGSNAVTWLVAQVTVAPRADVPGWRRLSIWLAVGLSGACVGLVVGSGRGHARC